MPFRYKLQKMLDWRQREKEKQETIVNKARQKLRLAEQRIEQNNQEILQVTTARKTADYSLMEYYDKYLHHLWDKAEQLEQARKEAEEELKIEIQKLIECEQKVKVLDKHKEKQKEIYLEEEKRAELKRFSELGVQRHFIRAREDIEEQEMIEQMMREMQEDEQSEQQI